MEQRFSSAGRREAEDVPAQGRAGNRRTEAALPPQAQRRQ